MTADDAFAALEAKEEELAQRDRQIDQLTSAFSESQATIRKLEHQLEQALKRLYGRRSEKWDPNQRVFDEMMIDAIEYLTQHYGTDPTVTRWVDQMEIWIVPAVNPDGAGFVHAQDPWWRKNRSEVCDGSIGVDLNRNFDVYWNGEERSLYVTLQLCRCHTLEELQKFLFLSCSCRFWIFFCIFFTFGRSRGSELPPKAFQTFGI